MSDIIHPGAPILFMKIGTHAQEDLEKIIARKIKEIEDAGYAMWGYGGNTCHPQSMVQPFAQAFEKKDQTIYLCMHEMASNHFAEQVRATQFSEDGISWKDIDPAINVMGSRYALFIKSLDRQDFELPLSDTRVAIGNNKGKSGDAYVKGRVDKACLEVVEGRNAAEGQSVKIGLVAKLIAPYAAYVR
jgi:hypothetical protein